MASHSSTLAWKIPWMEEPGRLQSMGSRRVWYDWATSLSLFTFTFHFHFSLSCIGEGNGNPLQCSCLESPRDEGAWWTAVYGVAQSRTQLKRLSSSSRITSFCSKCCCISPNGSSAVTSLFIEWSVFTPLLQCHSTFYWISIHFDLTLEPVL